MPLRKLLKYFKCLLGEIQEEMEVAVDRGNAERVRELLSSGADPNARLGIQMATYLHRAKSQEVVKALVAHGADVGALDSRERTPLHYAVVKGSKEIVSELLNSGVDVNAEDDTGMTALYVALSDYPEEGVVKELLDRGAFLGQDDLAEYLLCKFRSWSCPGKPVILSIAKLVVKFSLLMRDKGYVEEILKAGPSSHCPHHRLLASYRAECEREVERMKRTPINGRLSLFDCVLARRESVRPIRIPEEEEIQTEYPIYHETILPIVRSWSQRRLLFDKFTNLNIYARFEEDEVSLSFDCLCKIADYLSNGDLSKFTSSTFEKPSACSSSCESESRV